MRISQITPRQAKVAYVVHVPARKKGEWRVAGYVWHAKLQFVGYAQVWKNFFGVARRNMVASQDSPLTWDTDMWRAIERGLGLAPKRLQYVRLHPRIKDGFDWNTVVMKPWEEDKRGIEIEL